MAETDMELEWLFSHSFLFLYILVVWRGGGVTLNAMNEAYDLMMENPKNQQSGLQFTEYGV